MAKLQAEIFTTKIEALGGTDPLCEYTAKSGMVGYTYEGDLVRYHVPGTKDDAEMRDRMVIACTAALAGLQCKTAGILRVELKTNGHG